jgi:hypothetical protein
VRAKTNTDSRPNERWSPAKVRGLAMSLATVANWGSNLIAALTFLSLVQRQVEAAGLDEMKEMRRA